MKGLMKKEFYTAFRTCGVNLFMCVLFLVISAVVLRSNTAGQGDFLVVYACILGSMNAYTLLNLDERDGWIRYSRVFPYTDAQIVSAKYLFGLVSSAGILIIGALLRAITMLATTGFSAENYFPVLAGGFFVALVGIGILLPFVFRFGTAKGHYLYLAVIMLGAVGGSLASARLHIFSTASAMPRWGWAAMTGGAILVFAASWLLSIALYRRRKG